MAAQQTFAFFQSDDSGTKVPNLGGKNTVPPKTAKVATKVSGKRSNRRCPPQSKAPKPGSEKAAPENLAEKQAAEKTASEKTAASDSKADRGWVLKKLRAQVGCVSTSPTTPFQSLSTGCDALDSMLPSKGLRSDALTEWVTSSESNAAGVLSLIAAASHFDNTAVSGPLVVVDTQHHFYPPAAIALGIAADRIFVVHPKNNADAVWAIDQALRCDAVGAVWSHVGSWLDDRDARRFQLAAETGKTPGLFVRPKQVRGKPSFADIRFFVQPIGTQTSQLPNASFAARITIDRCRGGTVGSEMSVQINDQARIEPLRSDHAIQHVPAASQTAASHDTASHDEKSRREAVVMHLAEQLAHTAAKSSPASKHIA